MHDQAYNYVQRFGTSSALSILDIGGRDLNGTTRPLFPYANPYVVMDLREGSNVDIVADAATWQPDREYDMVLCTEVFEHTPHWPDICNTAYKALKPGGRFVVTCAGPGRPEHSGIEATGLQPGEYYGNVEPDQLAGVLMSAGFSNVECNQFALDIQATAVR